MFTTAVKGETFDSIVWRVFGNYDYLYTVIALNSNYSHLDIFEGGEKIILPSYRIEVKEWLSAV